MEQNRLRIIVEEMRDAIYEVADHYEITPHELAGLLLGQINYLFENKEDVIKLYRHAAEITSIKLQLDQEKPDGSVH